MHGTNTKTVYPISLHLLNVSAIVENDMNEKTKTQQLNKVTDIGFIDNSSILSLGFPKRIIYKGKYRIEQLI